VEVIVRMFSDNDKTDVSSIFILWMNVYVFA
jgi:hypothetical protein